MTYSNITQLAKSLAKTNFILFFFLISLVAHSQTKVAFPISSLSAADQAKLQNLHYGCDNLVDVVDDPGFGQHLSYNYTALSGYKYTDVLVGFNLNDPEFSISSYPTLAFGYKEGINNIDWGSFMIFRHWFTLQNIIDGNLNDNIIDDPFSSDALIICTFLLSPKMFFSSSAFMNCIFDSCRE